jgi:hypothetical protein
MYRNRGSHFERQAAAFEDNASDGTPRDTHAVDDKKLSDVRSEDINEKMSVRLPCAAPIAVFSDATTFPMLPLFFFLALILVCMQRWL